MTSAIESLHIQFPGQYRTGVKVNHPEVFTHNPHVVEFGPSENVRRIDMHYHETLNDTSRRPVHFMDGYVECLAKELGIPLRLGVNRPYIYLTDAEKASLPHVPGLPRQGAFALGNFGHKRDYVTKYPGHKTFQDVVDHYRGKITFVQIGHSGDVHRPVDGAINLVGRTSLRDLIRLCYHCEFVLSGITSVTHFAAAWGKPQITMIGGREHLPWIYYPGMIPLHTLGLLPCCRLNACWRNKVVPGQGDSSVCDLPTQLGDETVAGCMALLGAGAIIDAVDKLHKGGLN